MIHRFSISNFQSIRDPVELDFRIPGTAPVKPCFRTSPSHPEVRLPTVIAFYGPNGSGKTTVLRAMTDTISFAANSFDLSSQNTGINSFFPFLSKDKIAGLTNAEAEFDRLLPNSSPASLLRYKLELERDVSITFSNSWVRHEAVHTFPMGRPRRLLERRGNKPVYVAKELNVRSSDQRLSVVPKNASAISALGKMGVKSLSEIAEALRSVKSNVVAADPWRPETGLVAHRYRTYPQLVHEVSKKLQRFDLGIEEMEVVPNQETGDLYLVFKHSGLDLPVPLLAESAGARHLVHVFPELNFVLQTGGLAIIDALDNDFHTELTVEILNWFRRNETNPHNAQLICSLHNPSVMDELEKEEIFLVEKSQDGATTAFGLRDVQGLRRDSNLQKLYLGGAFGGLPAFG